MMRYRKTLWVALLSVGLVILAGCGGPGDAATDAPGLLPGITPTDGNTPAPPPTFTPEGTEDPDEGLIFDELTLTRTGGVAGTTTTITVLGNGALLIDGVLVGGVLEETVLDLDAQLDRMGFFRLDSHYGPAHPSADTFAYEITMQRGGMDATVGTVDGGIPDSLNRLIIDLLALEPVAPAPNPTTEPGAP